MTIRGNIILAEAATAHPDGTISMLRSGITRVKSPEFPLVFKSAVVFRLRADISDVGDHHFDVLCMDEDGAQLIAPLQIQTKIPEGGGHTNMITRVAIKIPKAGKYVFTLRVGGHELDTWMLTAVHIDEEASNG